MIKIYLCLTAIAALLFCGSCKKSNGGSTNAPTVYVAGNSYGVNTNSVATLWKNGAQILLGPDVQNYPSAANGLYVQDTDVYVCGATNGPSGGPLASYWQNGIVQNIGYGIALSIFASGQDVYVAGQPGVSYWKNGTLTTLSQNNGSGMTCNAIVAVGNDVYVAGDEPSAAYWKNGVETQLSVDYYLQPSDATAMAVSGGDVYVAGYMTDNYQGVPVPIATVWKNGISTPIGLADTNHLTSIFVSGEDVYIGGSQTQSGGDVYACYWKNGVAHLVTQERFSQANAIFVLDGDVYTAGFIAEGACYWKNATVTYLKGQKANAIFVK
jgi:hypothetical protein